ncbi:MAG: hypothetical protein SGPRY_013744 [Prymnesium sp.]
MTAPGYGAAARAGDLHSAKGVAVALIHSPYALAKLDNGLYSSRLISARASSRHLMDLHLQFDCNISYALDKGFASGLLVSVSLGDPGMRPHGAGNTLMLVRCRSSSLAPLVAASKYVFSSALYEGMLRRLQLDVDIVLARKEKGYLQSISF